MKKIFFLFLFALATSSAFGMDKSCPMLTKHHDLLEAKFSEAYGFDQWAFVHNELVDDFDKIGDREMRDHMIYSFLFIERVYSCYMDYRTFGRSKQSSFLVCSDKFSAQTCLCQYLLNKFWKSLLADHTF